MGAARSLLLAALLSAAGAATDLVPPHAAAAAACEPAALPGLRHLQLDALPDELVALARRAAANLTAAAEDGDEGAEEAGGRAEALLRRHPRVAAAAVALARRREASVVAFRLGGGGAPRVVRMGGGSNGSRLLDGFWRSVEPAWNSSTEALAPPFWDCLTASWLFGYAAPLRGQRRGAVGVFFSVEHLDMDPCNESFSPLFGGEHKCDPDTSTCVPDKGSGLARLYTCVCKTGFFSRSPRFGWRLFSSGHLDQPEDSELYRCVPCPPHCEACDGEGACMARQDYLLRTAVLGVQLLCMCGTLVLAAIVFKQRKCKTIASGMWTILETILLGILLLYATVVVRFFDPSVEQCLLEPWCRELGFVICYGAIILKLYRILIEFRTRKAHRWVVRDKDLLKYLLGMILVVFGYMAAWTATNLNFIQENYHVVTMGRTYEGLQFLACKALWWDYVTETGEILILVFGIHLSYACRNAATQFQERRFLCLAICVEAVVSGAFYALRVLYSADMHPDYTFLAYFARSQLTSTVVLVVIFVPKLWYQQKQATDTRGTRHYTTQEFSARTPLDAFKPQDGVTGTNSSDVDVGDINLADMNPEEIRAELKRLYTQLEVLKNKTIRADNPHISKRRGGRKVAHRRFSLQALHHRHQSRSTRHPQDHEPGEGEVSRTPEDSVCSIEGPSAIYNDGPSTYSELAGYGGGAGGGASSHRAPPPAPPPHKQ